MRVRRRRRRHGPDARAAHAQPLLRLRGRRAADRAGVQRRSRLRRAAPGAARARAAERARLPAEHLRPLPRARLGRRRAGGRARGPERPPRGRGGAAGRHAVADRLPAPGRPARPRLPARRRDALPAGPAVRRRREGGPAHDDPTDRPRRRAGRRARPARPVVPALHPRAGGRADLRVPRLALPGPVHRPAAHARHPPALPDAQHAPGAAAALGLGDEPGLPPRAGADRRHGRARQPHRAPERRHRGAPRAHDATCSSSPTRSTCRRCPTRSRSATRTWS